MAVPYTFGSATSSIPLSQLDSNFATTITLGNTAIQLGNTVTTLNNMTLANVTVSSGNVTVLNATVTNDATISGLTVGKGAGAVSTNTAVGASALQANSTAGDSVAIGYQALYSSNHTADTAARNTAVGSQAGYGATTGSENVVVGRQAGYSLGAGSANTIIGEEAGAALTGSSNTFLGYQSGSAITSGGKNTVIGKYSGNQNSIDIRTASNNCIVSDGDGNPQIHSNSSSWVNTPWGSIDVTQGASSAGTANSFGITSGTATSIFGGGNSFSGVFVINEFSQTGACALIITGGNGINIISQAPTTTFVNSTTPNSSQIGIYLSGSVIVVKPGVTGTSNFRIIAFRTRGSQ